MKKEVYTMREDAGLFGDKIYWLYYGDKKLRVLPWKTNEKAEERKQKAEAEVKRLNEIISTDKYETGAIVNDNCISLVRG